MAKPKVSKSQPELLQKPAETKPERVPVAVQDAFSEAFLVARGLNELLFVVSTSDEPLNEEGAHALLSVGDKLIEEMKIVDNYFQSVK